MASLAPDCSGWQEERLRYQVLRFVYDRAGADPESVLSGPEIEHALALDSSELVRVVDWLSAHGYLRHFGARPSVSLTDGGIHYVESAALRRRSLRD